MAPSSSFLVQRAWLGGDALVHDVEIVLGDGIIKSIEPGASPTGLPRLPGVALPGLVNTHSHAFHRALRGQTHRLGGDFWVWRERMYEIAAGLTPERYEQLATAVYTEMALAGITTVGEFHYVHHQIGGKPYDDPNEMGHALVRAAGRAGIRITLLDAAYLRAGFGEESLNSIQERFSDGDADRWLARVDDLAAAYAGAQDVRIGLAPHSVRAVPETELGALGGGRVRGVPVHIHVSEQPAENRACLEATGLTPTALLDRVGLLGEETTVVHATHVDTDDIARLGATGTGVCYCATTERDLADGIGPAGDLHAEGSPLSVGSDSHSVIDLFEETRGVELHERLESGRRGVFSPAELAQMATANGVRSLGFQGGRLEVGAPADITIVSDDTTRTASVGDDIAAILFSATAADVTDVYVAGRRIVSGGHHPGWEEARAFLAQPGR